MLNFNTPKARTVFVRALRFLRSARRSPAATTLALAGAPTIPISQVPMTVAIPAHPQIMLALGNSQSMDGTLSGAIMTGAGSLSGAYSA